jgi:hypothetical protein
MHDAIVAAQNSFGIDDLIPKRRKPRAFNDLPHERRCSPRMMQ